MAAVEDSAVVDTPFVTKTTIEAFLTKCVSSMKSEETRAALKDSEAGRPGSKLVEIQAKVWEELGLTVPQGRMAVNAIEKNYPDDNEVLLELRNEFSRTAEAIYLQSLEDRRPVALEKEAKLPRDVVLEFFDACNLKLDMPDVKERLAKHVSTEGSLPEEIINDIHQDIMELLGYEREHGKACFEKLGEDFAEDKEVAQNYQMWQRKTSVACLSILRQHQKEGGELNVEDGVKAQLLEMRAREDLDVMTPDVRGELLQKNAKKVQIFRSLPPDGRKRYLERLTEEEKVELAKSEILLTSVMQMQQQQRAQAQAQAQAEAQAEGKAKEEAVASESPKKSDRNKKKRGKGDSKKKEA